MPNGENLTDRELDELRETIRSLRDYQAEYHNHKENMAWAATAIYAAGIFAIIGFIYKEYSNLKPLVFIFNIGIPINILLIFLLAFSFLLVFIFIDAQLCARQRASDIVGACISLEFELLRRRSFYKNDLMRAKKQK